MRKVADWIDCACKTLSVVALCVALVSLERAAIADTLDSYSELAFPEEPVAPVGEEALRLLNSLGVVKLSSKIKVCVFGPDAVARVATSKILAKTVKEFPLVATQFLDLDCSNIGSLDTTGVEAVIWTSQHILNDVDQYLEVQQESGVENYREMTIQFLEGQEVGMFSVSVHKFDKSVQGRLLIKQESSPGQVRGELLRFVLFLLNPKSSIAKLDSQTVVRRLEDGNAVPSDTITKYLRLLYSGSVKLGDSESTFSSATQRCIDLGNC